MHLPDVPDSGNHREQLAFVALNVEAYEAEEAKKRQLAAQNNDSGRAVREIIPEQEKGKAVDKAAAAVGVNGRYVQDAKKIMAVAPELAQQVIQGAITLPEAQRAKERQGTRTDIVARLPQCSTGKARDKAAKAVGVGGRYVQDAKKVMAERRAGEILRETEFNSGTRLNGSVLGGNTMLQPRSEPPTLSDVGVTAKQSI